MDLKDIILPNCASLMDKQRYGEVRALLESYVGEHPHPEAFFLLGEATRQLGHGQLAMKRYLEALQLDPGHEPSLRGLSQLLEANGQIHHIVPLLDAAQRLTGRACLEDVRSAVEERMANLPLPASIQIEPTTKCNFRCLTCSRITYPQDHLDKDLPLARFVALLEQIPTLRRMRLQGMGEPLLHPELRSILAYAKSRGVTTEVISNGSLLHRHLDVLPHIDSLIVSFDTTDREEFARLRTGNMDKIIANLEKVMAAKRRGDTACHFMISAVISHLNVDQMPALARLAVSLGLDGVSFVEVENWKTPGEAEYENDRRFVATARTVVGQKSPGYLRQIEQEFPGFKVFGHFSPPKRRMHCGWARDLLYVTVDGFLTPCCLRTNPAVVNFGNVFETPFATLWRSRAMRDFRLAMTGPAPTPVCACCPD